MPVNGELGDAVTQREAIVNADKGPFSPLDQIYFVDNFREGMEGWKRLPTEQAGQVGLSALENRKIGAHGAVSGDNALCAMTRARSNSADRTIAIKRPTAPWNDDAFPETLRFETVFAFHCNPDDGQRSDVRELQFEFDCQNGTTRFRPKVRYEQYDSGGTQQNRWQTDDGDGTYSTVGSQNLMWNEPAEGQDAQSGDWRVSWHYLRFDIDFANAAYKELQCNDQVFDLSGQTLLDDTFEDRFRGLANPMMHIRTDSGHERSSLLYADSVCMSAEVN